jgi:hypothetical protein
MIDPSDGILFVYNIGSKLLIPIPVSIPRTQFQTGLVVGSGTK